MTFSRSHFATYLKTPLCEKLKMGGLVHNTKMSVKERHYKELTLSDRKALFASLYVTCKDGKIEHGQKVRTALKFEVAPKTVSRVWEDICSVMESHLVEHMELERLHLFEERTLPLRHFPDHVFDNRKKGRVGRKKVHDRNVLKERTKNVPLNERGTMQGLADSLNVSKKLIINLKKEAVVCVHSSAVKPYLTDENKEKRFKYCMEKMDLGAAMMDRPWQYQGMFDEIHVDEKWFNETFETRKYLLAEDELEPTRKVRHKKHIPRIMFLSAQARPRHDPHRNCMWDGKIAFIPIGNWVRQQRRSKYYKKGEERWKNRNVDTQAYFECMEDIVRAVAREWPRGQWADANFTVKIQQDGARPHTSNKFYDLWENLLTGLVLEGVLPSVNKVQLVTQPANSPDLNVNDNGFFNAIQAGYKKYAPKNAKEMIDAVLRTWREYPAKRINYMWLTLQTNFDEVIKCTGDNTYKIRHMNKAKLDRLGVLPTVIQVSAEARDIIENIGDSDDDYSVDTEMEDLLVSVEDEYRTAGYEPPAAITQDELQGLLADAEQPVEENPMAALTAVPQEEEAEEQ
jgi:hypothetical protein